MPEDKRPDTVFFERLAEATGAGAPQAPSRLKSKIYSSLIEEMQVSGPLMDLAATAESDPLCVFETLLEKTPLPERAACFNACRLCHARVMGERIENAPIYWQNCPYVDFQGR